MVHQERATYVVLETPGHRLTVDIVPLASGFRCEVLINGAITRKVRRTTLLAALRWGLDTAEWQADVLGLTVPLATLETAYDAIAPLLAA